MLVPWSIILGGAGQVKAGAWRAPVLWTTLALVAVLMLAALVLAVVDRWRKRSRPDRLSPGEQLSHFRALYEKGELSREEYERIRTLLGGKLREELHLPAGRPAGAAPAPGPQTGIQAIDDRLRPPPPPGSAGTEPGPPPPPPATPDNGPAGQ